MLAEQWYLFPPGDRGDRPGSINAIEAWRHIRPAGPIVVALLDLGVNYTHPDLAANIWKNERETPNGKDDDGNGYIDDLHGWDFAYANNNPMRRPSRKFPDQFDHGTALASLMAAVPDNGIGTAGVGRNIKIMNLRVGGDPEREGQEAKNRPTKTLSRGDPVCHPQRCQGHRLHRSCRFDDIKELRSLAEGGREGGRSCWSGRRAISDRNIDRG